MWFGPDFVCEEERNNGWFLLSKYCEGGREVLLALRGLGEGGQDSMREDEICQKQFGLESE